MIEFIGAMLLMLLIGVGAVTVFLLGLSLFVAGLVEATCFISRRRCNRK